MCYMRLLLHAFFSQALKSGQYAPLVQGHAPEPDTRVGTAEVQQKLFHVWRCTLPTSNSSCG